MPNLCAREALFSNSLHEKGQPRHSSVILRFACDTVQTDLWISQIIYALLVHEGACKMIANMYTVEFVRALKFRKRILRPAVSDLSYVHEQVLQMQACTSEPAGSCQQIHNFHDRHDHMHVMCTPTLHVGP